jgi:hypothetical protein
MKKGVMIGLFGLVLGLFLIGIASAGWLDDFFGGEDVSLSPGDASYGSDNVALVSVEVKGDRSCVDADAINGFGASLFVKDSAEYKLKSGRVRERKDRCAGKSRVREAICKHNGRTRHMIYECPQGSSCVSGACTRPVVDDKDDDKPGKPLSGTYPLFSETRKIYLNDSVGDNLGNPTILRKDDLGSLLKTRTFNGNVDSDYTQEIEMGEDVILKYGKQPTSDLDPDYHVKFSTSTSNPNKAIYEMKLNFARAIDFTHSDSKREEITLFGRKFTIGEGTNDRNLVLIDSNSDKLVLSDGQTVKKGASEESVKGTVVIFNENQIASSRAGSEHLTGIKIRVAAPNSAEDAIRKGESFVDPVFGTFKLDFDKLNIPEGSPKREIIDVKNRGDDKMDVTFTDHRGLRKTITWAISNDPQDFRDGKFGTSLSHDKFVNITVVENYRIRSDWMVVVGNEDEGFLLQLTDVYNDTDVASPNDIVSFTDVFSKERHDVSWVSEGVGTMDVGGKSYVVRMDGDTNTATENYEVRIDYPDSVGLNTVVIFPTIQTSKGSKISLYNPVSLTPYRDFLYWYYNEGYFAEDVGGEKLEILRFPDGDGYTDIKLKPLGEEQPFSVGELNFIKDKWNRIYLKNINGKEIDNPAIIIFEEKDDRGDYNAMIVELEPGASSDDGMGVKDVERTWSNDDIEFEHSLASDQSLMKEVDVWGSIITTDTRDSDQYKAKISYPDEMVYAEVFVRAVGAGGGSSGGGGSSSSGGGPSGGGGGSGCSSSKTFRIGPESYTAELVSASDTAASIKISDSYVSETKEITEGTSKIVNGVSVKVVSSDETNLKLSVTVEIDGSDFVSAKLCNG